MRRKVFLGLSLSTIALLGAALAGASATIRPQPQSPDFDRDGIPDAVVWRPPTGDATSGVFFAILSGAGFSLEARQEAALGVAGDFPVVADYDGDGIPDLAVYHPFRTFAWSILLSSQNYTGTATYQWGVDKDVPVPGDYDGDGKVDIAVYRALDTTWYILQGARTFTSAFAVKWGAPGGTPVPADYDGDGKLDIAFYYPNADGDSMGAFFVLRGPNFNSAFKAKLPIVNDGTVPAPADFDGDGKVDIAVYDGVTNTFSLRYAATNYTTGVSKVIGVAGDVLAPADYDGDGKADIAVFRPSTSTYYILTASSGFTTQITRYVVGGSAGVDQPVLLGKY